MSKFVIDQPSLVSVPYSQLCFSSLHTCCVIAERRLEGQRRSIFNLLPNRFNYVVRHFLKTLLGYSNILLLVFAVLFPYFLLAQNSTAFNASKVLPPPPDAAGFAKYGEIPVSLYTGVPNIEVPLYTLKSKDISIPITLSYHSGGIKVEEEAGWTGLGWSLNVGGVITRQIKGGNDLATLNDGFHGTYWVNNAQYQGYPYDPAIPTTMTQDYLGKVCLNQVDPEPDVFYFNMPGKSGSFILEKGQTPGANLIGTPMTSQKIDIKYDRSINKWVIRTVDGFTYQFGFNGKEQDPEVSGTGNQYDYGFRIYNPRIGRFLSVDPLTKSYPWYTPYQFAGNKPIIAVDLDGLEEKVVVNEYYDGNLVKTQTLYYKDIMARLPVIPAEIDIIPGQGIVNIDRRRFSGMGIIGENNYDDYTYQPDPNRLVVSTTRVYTNSVVQALTKQSKWVQENINTAGYGVDASVSAKADINGTATSGEAKLNFQALAYQNQAGKVKLNENVSLSVAANGTSTSKDKNIIANSSLSLNAKSEVFGYFFLKSGTKDIVAEGFTPESTTSFKLSNLKVEYTRSASGNMTFKLGLTDQPGFELKTSLLKEKAVLQSNTSCVRRLN